MAAPLTIPMLCRRAFFLCAIPRSGSTLLCDLLQQTRVAGNPTEYGSEDDERVWRHGLGFGNHRNYFLHYSHRLCVTGNGVFSAKMMFEQVTSFVSDLARYKGMVGASLVDAIDSAFGNPLYVQVMRKDKERQAVSFVRAAQTGAWNWIQAPRAPPTYDPALLDRAEHFLLQRENAWEQVLRGVEPARRMTVYYEDAVEDMEGTVSSLLAWLQIADSPHPFKPPSTRRQSDTITDEWLHRWREHKLIALRR